MVDYNLAEKERNKIEKELNDQELDFVSDLKKESDNYNTRLCLDSMNDQVELDFNSTNVVKTARLWNGNNRKTTSVSIGFDQNFSLYDIYIKITSKEAFTRKDIIALKDIKFQLAIGGYDIFYRDFCSALFFELIDEQDILLEENIIYLKVFTFENMLYGRKTVGDDTT